MSWGPFVKPNSPLMDVASKLMQLLTNNHLKKYDLFYVGFVWLY